MSTKLPLIIIGAGPVGLAAAAHALTRGLDPLVLEAGPRAALAVAGPLILVRRRPHDRLPVLAAWATWTETGAAFGPLVAAVAATCLAAR